MRVRLSAAHMSYYQVQRKAIYQQYAHQLITSGYAYPCYCTPSALKQCALPGGAEAAASLRPPLPLS